MAQLSRVGGVIFVSRFTGLSPCTMAQIPTRQRILASQNLWKHEGQVTTQKRTAPSITTKGNRSSTNDRQGRWWMHAQWKQHSLHTTPITCCTSQGYVQAAVGHESFEFEGALSRWVAYPWVPCTRHGGVTGASCTSITRCRHPPRVVRIQATLRIPTLRMGRHLRDHEAPARKTCGTSTAIKAVYVHSC